jgi:large-conductance mechanosensitive channel
MALIFGADSLSELYTVLREVKLEDGTLDLANSIYIDWGSFINAVINFFIIAFVLFSIVKIINRFRSEHREFSEKMMAGIPDKADRKTMRKADVRLSDKAAVAAYYAEKKKAEEEAAAKAAAEAAAKAAADRAANPTPEDLLKENLKVLQK